MLLRENKISKDEYDNKITTARLFKKEPEFLGIDSNKVQQILNSINIENK